MTASGALGTILTDAKGQTLYLFAADTSNVSTCNGQCAQYWPPLVTTGTPQAGGSAASSKLGTSKRKDGTTQVTYGGHPLYRYASDKKPGDTTGQGLDLSGGRWWVVGVDGAMITGGPGGGSASPSASAGYSRGY
jgi:predicted lipoprotein with Yx(FWY)xxD motif